MAYSNVPIGTPNPGCFVILVDQSYSMSGQWQTGTKTEVAALIVSRLIYELGLACDTGQEIKDRCHVSVIGYGAEVECLIDGMISDVYNSPIAMRKVTRLLPDGAGGTVEVEADAPIWLQPMADNGTPMHTAFEYAAEVAGNWCSEHPNNFPPVVFNITDGAATEPDLTIAAAQKVMNIQTEDGNVLVFNVHIADSGSEVTFPHNTAPFADDIFAKFLFGISSVLPEPLRREAETHGFDPQHGARCLGYNAHEATLINMLQFGTLQSLGPGGEGNS